MVVETAQTVQKQPSDGEVAVVHVKPDQSNKVSNTNTFKTVCVLTKSKITLDQFPF